MATDRLIDLGVDIPGGDVQDLLAVTGSDFEAVLVGSTSSWHQPPIIRLDGTEIPVVRASDWAGDDHVGAAIRTIVDAARRTPKPPDTSVDGWHPPVTTDGVGIKRAPNVDGASPTVDQPEGEGQAPSEQVTQARRELEFARAEVALKDEYIATFEPEISILEARLDEALGFLREKTAYIESLPMVRLKIWVNRLGNRSRR